MSLVIEALDVKLIRGKKEILSVNGLELHKGEFLSVVGPNGAGKSTLLLVLALLVPPSSGQIRFMGEVVTGKNSLSFRRRMAVVFQEPLLLNTTVFNNVAQGLKFRGVPRKEASRRVVYWLDRLGIAHLSDRGARNLSGGEAKRVSLARALALQPEVLFLDEPFTALDFPTRSELVNDLGDIIRESGITTFFVTHDYFEIPGITWLRGNTAVVSEGSIVYRGRTKDFFDGDLSGLPASLALFPAAKEMKSYAEGVRGM
ncbi:MAG: ATP-binding cassette domain-containing protein [Bacillota bacterium]